MSRTAELCHALAAWVEAIPPDQTLGRRLRVVLADDPRVDVEDPAPLLQLYPLGDERSTQNGSLLLRRPVVAALFTGAIAPEFSRDQWLGLVEAVVDSLELRRKITGASGRRFSWFAASPESLWDPQAITAGRFAALWRLTYSAPVVTR